MSNATLDRLLAVLVLVMAVTGLVTLRGGTPAEGWIYVLHGLLGGSLLGAVALKLKRSVPAATRRRSIRRLAAGIGLAVVALVALGLGFGWVVSAGIPAVGPWTVLSLHAGRDVHGRAERRRWGPAGRNRSDGRCRGRHQRRWLHGQLDDLL